MSEQKYAYSGDGERYHLDVESAIDYLDPDRDEVSSVQLYKGELMPHSHSDFFVVDWLVEDMQNRACEECGDFAEDYLDDMTKEKHDQLEEVIKSWFEKNMPKPTFFTVTNIKEINFKLD